MICRRTLSALLLGGAFLPLSGCKVGTPDYILHYRMTVAIETPEGVRVGSSVRQLRFFDGKSSFPFGESKPQVNVVGEAVAVDLPNRKTVFALLTGADGDVDYAGRIADRSGLSAVPQSGLIALWPNAPSTVGLKNTSPLPMLVTFKDINHPSSVERVDPDKLDVSLGNGYRLKSVTVQVVDGPVTAGIGQRLKWLPNYYDKMLDGDSLNRSQVTANNLSQNSFQQGQIR